MPATANLRTILHPCVSTFMIYSVPKCKLRPPMVQSVLLLNGRLLNDFKVSTFILNEGHYFIWQLSAKRSQDHDGRPNSVSLLYLTNDRQDTPCRVSAECAKLTWWPDCNISGLNTNITSFMFRPIYIAIIRLIARLQKTIFTVAWEG
jgi:hypothetical protein